MLRLKKQPLIVCRPFQSLGLIMKTEMRLHLYSLIPKCCDSSRNRWFYSFISHYISYHILIITHQSYYRSCPRTRVGVMINVEIPMCAYKHAHIHMLTRTHTTRPHACTRAHRPTCTHTRAHMINHQHNGGDHTVCWALCQTLAPILQMRT